MPRPRHSFGQLAIDLGDDNGLECAYLRSGSYGAELASQMAFQPDEASLPLWDYQAHAVQVLLEALDPGQAQLLQLATGGGKTRVANQVIETWTGENPGAPVIWVTKDWRLLAQAATDLGRRHRIGVLGRIGGYGRELHPLPEDEGAAVLYTTVHTLQRRLDALRGLKPSLVVWDECHWGEHGGARKILSTCRKLEVPVLGLTATPRKVSSYRVAYSRSFRELVDAGYLARPVVTSPIPTGASWHPSFRRGFDDVSSASLRELADNPGRNRCIVNTYLDDPAAYGRSIVFGCNIDHANKLAELFAKKGVAARAIHSGNSELANRRVLEGFRRGAVTVLTTVDMLTHGVDVPSARSVFLARPTTSDILFAQMVGRAARRDEATGKTTFNLVEFTDNVSVHAELLETAQQFFDGAAGTTYAPAKPAKARPRLLRRHRFDTTGAPTWIPDDATLPEAVRGLWYRAEQTFGIEIELTTADGSEPPDGVEWLRKAEVLRLALARALPGRVARRVHQDYQGSEGAKDPTVWSVEPDASAGWEVTSRILKNLEGFQEVVTACAALDAAAASLGLHVDYRTGLHVHIGWLGKDAAEVRRAIRLARLFEPALGTLVAPSRIAAFDGAYHLDNPNPFCKPVSTVFTASRLSRATTLSDIVRIAGHTNARYVTFNVRPLAHIHTVEVRMHGGTLEARKILLWLSLWMQILWAASRWQRIDRVPDRAVIEPNGDIVALAAEWLPEARQPQQRAFLDRLHARRIEIRDGPWQLATSLLRWMLPARRWRAPTEVATP